MTWGQKGQNINRYPKYLELLDGAEEDFDRAIYCNRRSHLYMKVMSMTLKRKLVANA